MKSLINIFCLLLMALTTACGGGGGSAGTTSGSSSTGSTTTTAVIGTTTTVVIGTPTLTLELRDEAGAATSTVSPTGSTVLIAVLKKADGSINPQQLIDVAGDSTQLKFPDGTTMLTDSATGIARLRVQRAGVTAVGVGKLTATYANGVVQSSAGATGVSTASAVPLVTSIAYQLGALDLALTNLNLGAPNLAAYGTRVVTLQVGVNGAVPASPVAVNFTASCGAVEPLVVNSNSNGLVSVTYKANNAQGCGGTTVNITASTTGAVTVAGNILVLSAPATNLQFVSATPPVIFLSGSGGSTQSVVKFRVVNSTGAPLQSFDVLLSLSNSPSGISLGMLGNTSPVTATTDLTGEVTVPVFSGTVPTSIVVSAALLSNPLIQTTSSILTVASGRPAQARSSLAVEKFAVEGFGRDGETVAVTMSLADRQGNPVPDGTSINFITQGGVMIPPTCTITGGKSQCGVTLRAQAPRPTSGRVAILAYTPGEEDFVDLNGNNAYDAGEPFTDLGNAFRDDRGTGYFSGATFIPRVGNVPCTGGFLGVPNTCDGVWGAADVRQQAVVVFATGAANVIGTFQAPIATGTTTAVVGIDVIVSDLNGNSVPTGSVILATAVLRNAGSGGQLVICSNVGATTTTVANTLGATQASFGFIGCKSGDLINIKVTTPLGTVTSRDFPLPP